ncbi:hypothetical protein [Geopsychrobacter electrodiphilus]|uniref:hypothetical protein n=1 Tax=Geopsychrobacter electrodiphilus TaxID=225196 RepID=UPI0003620FF9|nr:hypothetical protein [Geopsychrobacter electrodiphilus]
MKVADRFRQIALCASALVQKFSCQPDGTRIDRAVNLLRKGSEELAEWSEQAGEIPQMKLEHKLSPVLLQVHSTFDRARVLYEEADKSEEGALIWDVEQQIYRLLNDL